MSIVAAFLGGILFSYMLIGAALWWACRGVETPGFDECRHCDGTGLISDAAEPPQEASKELK